MAHHPYADFIKQVAKPNRYMGGEYQSVTKDPDSVAARIVLAFPDLYEIGMSHLGTKILYSLLNKDQRIACERAFAPWADMEEQLRERQLPLVSLESASPLKDFDVIGVSLQYELTYTNVLTLLDLGGVPVRAADRTQSDPLVLGGGPTTTHPEPIAPFFDAFFIGEAEEELPDLLVAWSAMRRSGRPRLEALAELAAVYPLYVPALYETHVEEQTGFAIPVPKLDEQGQPLAPARVRRAMVEDINKFPFPSDTPVPFAEAVFDRASVEIARGCTEGCRFCQAGMIYRPVRERSPQSVVDSIVGLVDKAGYDEASLTSLSTADYSCITPLVKNVMSKLRDRKVSLSVSSLRAYGLNEELLDELSSVRSTGLTFAPEAGTQRMRDVVNKNVTEDHISESAARVFRKGWDRLKLYFMIGLPTEEDVDIRGIVETGARMLDIGRKQVGNRAAVTVSVSTHVPKPHTPFQWCAMDTSEETVRKQRLLRAAAGEVWPRVKLRMHDSGSSHIEGIIARGDRRLADVIEHVWKNGGRFDGWEEMFDAARWQDALTACDVDPSIYLGTIATDAKLPWDHIDVGLADGFLAWEYRRSLKDRLSLPCGKPKNTLLHHTNVKEAVVDERRLVCYDCGVACDLTKMRDERIDYLREIGADEPSVSTVVQIERPRGKRNVPRPTFTQGEGVNYRLRLAKVERAAYMGHLDLMRLLARLFRRAGLSIVYSRGFHPKPIFSFGPALGLGIPSMGEVFDVRLEEALDEAKLVERLNEVAPEGLIFSDARTVHAGDPSLAKVLGATDYAFVPGDQTMASLLATGQELFARETLVLPRKKKSTDVRPFLLGTHAVVGPAATKVCKSLGWPEHDELFVVRVSCGAQGSVRPAELAELFGLDDGQVCRLAFWDTRQTDAPADPLAWITVPAAPAAPEPQLGL